MLATGTNVDAECGCERAVLSLASTNWHIAFASLLISQGADFNLVDKDGVSALTMAAANQNADIVALLVAHYADVNQINDKGDTALWSAIKDQQIEMARTRLAHKANPNVDGERGWTMLMEAVRNGSLPMVKLLLATGERELMEGNTSGDTTWGFIFAKDGLWKGRNELGKILIRVRDELNERKQSLSCPLRSSDN